MIEAGVAVTVAESVTLDRIVTVFHNCFAERFDIRLEGGFSEPLYVPGSPARICFREDYVNSALHEISHWCIAGHKRRQCRDYGYWYADDARDGAAQRRFEAVECRPQALECLLATACGLPFRTSIDNLVIADYDAFGFRLAVWQRVQSLQRGVVGARAEQLLLALTLAFRRSSHWRSWPIALAQVA